MQTADKLVPQHQRDCAIQAELHSQRAQIEMLANQLSEVLKEVNKIKIANNSAFEDAQESALLSSDATEIQKSMLLY